MRAFDYFMLIGGIVMLIGAAHGATRGRKDVVEVTALAVVGLGIMILGVDKVWPAVPAVLEILASLLLIVGGLLFLGLKQERKTS